MNLEVYILDCTTYPDRPEKSTRITLIDGIVSSEPKNFLNGMESEGIMGKGGKIFRPSDGEAFMHALQYQFSGTASRASSPQPI